MHPIFRLSFIFKYLKCYFMAVDIKRTIDVTHVMIYLGKTIKANF